MKKTKILYVTLCGAMLLSILSCKVDKRTGEPVKEVETVDENTDEPERGQYFDVDDTVKSLQTEAAQKALQYINGKRTFENHKLAYQWALKADSTTKAKVLQQLEELGFPIP